MPNTTPNPFDKEETLQPFFEGNEGYVATKDTNLKHCMTNQTHASTKTQSALSSVINYFQKHIAVAILAAIVLTGTIGVAAVELFGPDNIKPSSLFTSKTSMNTKKDYSTTVDGFSFKYNTDSQNLDVAGSIKAPSSCYDIISSELLAQNIDSRRTFKLVVEIAAPKTQPESKLCEQVETMIDVTVNYKLVLEQSELDLFDGLFSVQPSKGLAAAPIAVKVSKPFVEDDTYAVAVSDACDLAVRYQRMTTLSDGSKFSITSLEQNTNFLGGYPAVDFSLNLIPPANTVGAGPSFAGLLCYNLSDKPSANPIQSFLERKNDQGKIDGSVKPIPTPTLTPRADFCKEYRLTVQSCDLLPQSVPFYPYGEPDVNGFIEGEHLFVVNSVLYSIYGIYDSQTSENSRQNTIDYEFQFNSLAPSKGTAQTPGAAPVAVTPFFPVPAGYAYEDSLCDTKKPSNVQVNYDSNISAYSRGEGQVFLEVPYAKVQNGLTLVPTPGNNANESGYEFRCYTKATLTSTSFLQRYNEVGVSIDDATVRDQKTENMSAFFEDSSLAKIKNAKYITLKKDYGDGYSKVLTAFEYGDYIITIEYSPEANASAQRPATLPKRQLVQIILNS